MRAWMLLLVFAVAGQVHADMLDTRLASIAAQTHRRAEFRETYTASYLNKPIVSYGVLEYQAPDRLVKIITRPEAVRYSVQKGIMRVQRGDDVKQIDLKKQPLLGMGISALRDLLQGDRQDLEARFWTSYDAGASDPDNWQLLLIPRDKNLVKRVNRVIMRGHRDQLQEVIMEYTSGERLVTRITGHE